jgi:hypothetical protein
MSYSFTLGNHSAGTGWDPYNSVTRWNTYTTSGSTTTVYTGTGAYTRLKQTYEEVQIPQYSTTTTVTGGVRSISNLDLRSTWGQPIPLLWGHTRVKAMPIWASMPQERTSGGGGGTSPRLTWETGFGDPG